MRLSDHFVLKEFTTSQTAQRKGIDNDPSNQVIDNLRALCQKVLEPIRTQFGPVIINSGYRSPKLNKAIGGSTTSQHCKGQAADIVIPTHDNMEVAKYIQALLPFDQLILEFYPGGWVHVSYNEEGNRGQVLRAVSTNGKTKYLTGLED